MSRRITGANQSICLSLLLAIGLSVLWGIAVVWTIAVVQERLSNPKVQEHLQMDAKGELVIVQNSNQGSATATEFLTLDRQPLKLAPNAPMTPGATLGAEMPKSETTENVALSREFITGFSDDEPSPTDWYFVVRDQLKTQCFIGFDRRTRRQVGYLSEAGFQDQAPNSGEMFQVKWNAYGEQFLSYPGSGSQQPSGSYSFTRPNLYMISRDDLLRVNFQARQIEKVFHAPGMIAISVTERRKPNAPTEATDRALVFETVYVVRALDTLTVFNSGWQQEVTFHIPQQLQKESFHFFLQPDGKAIANIWRNDRKMRMTSTDVIWFSKEGTITKQLQNATVPTSYGTTIAESILPGVSVPALIFPLMISLVSPVANEDVAEASVARRMADLWPSFLIAALCGILAVVLHFRRSAKFGQAIQIRWIIFFVLCGLPGYIGYLLHRNWPVRLGCPTCRAEVPRDRESCVTCGVAFPAPTANGLEVFA